MKIFSHQFNLLGSPCYYLSLYTPQGLQQYSNLGNSALAYSLDDVVAFLFHFQLRKVFKGANFSYPEESFVSLPDPDTYPSCVNCKSINIIYLGYNCIISLASFNYSTYSLDTFNENKTKTVLSQIQ